MWIQVTSNFFRLTYLSINALKMFDDIIILMQWRNTTLPRHFSQKQEKKGEESSISSRLHNTHDLMNSFHSKCPILWCIFSLLLFWLLCQTWASGPLKLCYCYINSSVFPVVHPVLFFLSSFFFSFFFFPHPSVTWHATTEPSDCDKFGLELTK